MTSALKDSLRRHAIPILCLSLLPILVGLISDDWLYTGVEYLDPWYNVGLFDHYADPQFLSGHYKESRLSWLAPGYYLYKGIGPLAANFVLHLGALIAAVVFVYLTLARLVSRNAAILVAGMLCAYYPFHGSGGWDYQTTPSGAYYALTLYLLTVAAQSAKPAGWLVGAGAAFAATFHADILFVNMAPGLAAHYLVIARPAKPFKAAGLAAAWGLLGFVTLTQVLCFVAWSVGRDPLFFKPIVEIVFNYTLDPQTTMGAWWRPWSEGWILLPWVAAYLLPLAAVVLAGVVWLAGQALRLRIPADRRPSADPVRIMLIGQYLFVFALWIIWQSLGHTALQPDYFAYPLIIPAFMALGALVGRTGWPQLALFGLALVAAYFIDVIPRDATLTPQIRATASITALWVMLAAIVAGVVPGLRSLAAVIAATVYLWAYTGMAYQGRVLWTQAMPANTCEKPRKIFLETVRLGRLFHDRRLAGERTFLWWGPNESADWMCDIPINDFRGVLISTGTVLALNPPSTESAATLTPDSLAAVLPTDRVAAIVQDQAHLKPLVTRFATAGRALTLERQDRVDFGAREAYIAVYKVSP